MFEFINEEGEKCYINHMQLNVMNKLREIYGHAQYIIQDNKVILPTA